MATVRKREWGEGKEAWILTYTDDAGKRRQETFNSKKAADNRRREVEHEIDIGVHVSKGETLRLYDAVDEYIRDCERLCRLGDMKNGTVWNRKGCAKRVPAWLGAMRVTDITSQDVQRWIDELRETYKPRTVNGDYVLVFCVMQFCVKRKWLRRNTLRDERVTLPKMSKRAKIPSIEDLGTLLATANDILMNGTDIGNVLTNANRLCAIILGIYGGLRPSEAFGLHWEDINYETGFIHVQRGYTWRDGLKPPKTAAGNRKVPLNKQIVYGLDQVARYWAAKLFTQSQLDRSQRGSTFAARIIKNFRDGRGEFTNRSGFVIKSRTGDPLSSHRSWYFFDPVMKRAGLVDQDGKIKFTQHALRHAHASLLLKENLPLHQLKQVMGHSSAQFTIDAYGHIFPEDDLLSATSNAIADRGLDATRMRHRLISG
jgi:integrase